MTEVETIQPFIRPARSSEARSLSTLALRSKAHWEYDDEFMAACVDELTISAECVQKYPTYLIEGLGRILGFYLLQPLNDHEIELGYLFVEPDVIGQGYGSRLFRHAVAIALHLNYRTMLIQSDPNAEPFYQAMGAQKMGVKHSGSIPGRELPLFKVDLLG